MKGRLTGKDENDIPALNDIFNSVNKRQIDISKAKVFELLKGVHILAFQEHNGDRWMWVAVCIEHYFVDQGRNMESAVVAVCNRIRSSMIISFDYLNKNTEVHLCDPAPKYIQDLADIVRKNNE